jgi:hypothetical protein
MLGPVSRQPEGSKSGANLRLLLELIVKDPKQAKERFPDFRLVSLVADRLDMDHEELTVFCELTGIEDPGQARNSDPPFGWHLRDVIDRFGLASLFREDGPGRHHHAIRPTGYDYDTDEVDAEEMKRWRADYRAMVPERQMLAASIVWLYRGGKDSRWLRRVPCTWNAADALTRMRDVAVLHDWGRLISLYPGW